MDRQGMFPEKLVIEPTTRCNFKCNYCVKQSAGCRIPEGDVTDEVVSGCASLFPHLSSVIFTGVGEPLLHPKLNQYIEKAAALMPVKRTIGFQTNGKLLTRKKAAGLLQSGMNKICISVDTVNSEVFDRVRSGGTLNDIYMALDALAFAKQETPGAPLETGIEFVLMNKNLEELPRAVQWAGRNNVDFILVTHLTAHKKDLEKEQVFFNSSHEAIALFETYRQKAIQNDLDIMRYSSNMVRYYQSEKEQALCELVARFKNEALKRDLYVNLFHLLSEQPGRYDKVRLIFDRARELAAGSGIELVLPRIRPRTRRQCPFVEDNTLFVTWQGHAAPCYFLWHPYTTVRAGDTKYIDPVYFGNVGVSAPEQIWRADAFSRFRKQVKQYDYPNCHAWCESRCDYVLEAPFTQDCCINDIPCCDCYWGLGLLNCLL